MQQLQYKSEVPGSITLFKNGEEVGILSINETLLIEIQKFNERAKELGLSIIFTKE